MVAAKVKELVDEGHPFADTFAICFYVHDGQQQKAIDALKVHFQFSNDPWYGLTLALLYDQRKDPEKCLATLNRVKAVGHKYTPPPADKPMVELMNLAVQLADDLTKGGKGELDLVAVEKLRASANIAIGVNIDYFVGYKPTAPREASNKLEQPLTK